MYQHMFGLKNKNKKLVNRLRHYRGSYDQSAILGNLSVEVVELESSINSIRHYVNKAEGSAALVYSLG